MQRLSPRLGLLLALLLGVPLSVFLLEHSAPETAAPASSFTASSTVSVIPQLPAIPATTQPPQATTTSQEPPAPKETKKTTASPAPAPAKVTPAPSQPVAPVVQAVPALPPPAPITTPTEVASGMLRSALVNIICYAPAGSALHSISGSGVFIDSKGIIITNAHIAQYFLLADRGVSCTIRAGSPAIDAYKAALIYISPAWIRANSTVLTQTLPTGTGEYDFALLAVTSSATSAKLPVSFPAVTLAQLPPASGTPVVIASFGAQFLSASQIRSNLSPTVVFGSVKDIFTFGTNTIDVLSLGGSAAAQEGSSGGGVVNASGTLVGLLTTSTVTGDTDTRTLSAITASYIRAEFASEMGSALDLLLSEPTEMSVREFSTQIPKLEAIITAQLP